MPPLCPLMHFYAFMNFCHLSDRYSIVWIDDKRRSRQFRRQRNSRSRAGIPSEPRYRPNSLVFAMAKQSDWGFFLSSSLFPGQTVVSGGPRGSGPDHIHQEVDRFCLGESFVRPPNTTLVSSRIHRHILGVCLS